MKRLTTYKSFTRPNYFIALLVLLLTSSRSSAQLVVDDDKTAMDLVSRFIGSNVTIVGVPSLLCSNTHNAFFDNGNMTNLGLDRGIILSTGVTQTGGNQGANITNGQTALWNAVAQDVPYGSVLGHPILGGLSGNPITQMNRCVLEFDFTADIDTISQVNFQYVFASDEYEAFNCSGYNDVFGFVISGPGITGAPNIAVVPGTNIPVMINSINSGSNINTNCTSLGTGSPFTSLYVNNNNGTTIAYNGFTVVLTAQAQIQPCDTYHMFLGIQNTGDDGYQSAVFLKENSFSVDTTVSDLAGLVGAGESVVEGCIPTSITYAHDTSLQRRKKLCFHFSSRLGAENGVDYTYLADTLIIAPNQYSNSLVINPIADGSQETFYTWDPVTGQLLSAVTDTILIYELNCCTLDTLKPKDSIKLPLLDELYMHLITRDTFYCANNVPSTDMLVTGDPLYSYLWTPSASITDPTDTTTTTIAGMPTQTTTYTITASYPGCPDKEEEVTIIIEPLPIVNVTPDNAALCLTEPYQITTTVDPPNSPYAYSWEPADGNLSSTTIPNPTFWYLGAGVFTYTLSVTTPHQCEGRDSITIEAYPGIISDIRISDTNICSNDSLIMEVTVFPDSMTNTATYSWSPSTFLNDPNIMEPTYMTTVNESNTYTYTLITTNSFGCHDTDQITINSLVLPEVKIMDDTALCLHEPTQIFAEVGPAGGQFTYEWTPTSLIYGSSNVRDPFFWNDFNTDHGDYQLFLKVTEVTGGCRNYDTINIHTYPHVFLETIDDQVIKYGSQVQLWANNTGVSDLNSYAWEPPAYLNNPNIASPVALGQETTLYTVYGWNNWGCRDTAEVNVSVDPTMDEFVPSVFSPNNDGRNDIFRILNMRYQKLVEFRVFNRWGKELYNSTDATKGWDGTYNGAPQDPGVYNYIIRVNVPNAEQKVYKGTVTLIR